MMNNTEEIAIFCENVRRLRTKHGLSKKEMARRLEIGVHSLSLLESGVLPKWLGCDIIYAIHDHFGITPNKMVTSLLEKS